MLGAIALLLICQMAGEAVHRFAGVPVPGSVIGMALLLVWLALVRRERPSLEVVTGWLTTHLAIMFVPAAVGLMNEGPVLARHGVAIIVATVISTLLTLVVTALVFQWAVRRMEHKDRKHDGA
ncbi:CidA/LrgA family protein [Brevundimonas sp. BH3]|uniref:CidA/LrgA family protein n=1 Tax=unclassified Brevundimonas TaxID=2622653 RepID=UPI0028A2A595|nr:CidA/LrgA family protein [Brevundimonas sp.]